MLRIFDDPDSGKTKKLLQFCSDLKVPCVFVCKNPTRMREKSHAYGINSDNIYFCNYGEYINANYRNDSVDITEHTPVYVDELEDLLVYLGFTNISGYTITNNHTM